MGESQKRKSWLAPNSKPSLSATPVALNKNHQSTFIVSHHTVHLSVMDGSVGMTANQSQPSTKRMPVTDALCFIPRIKTTSACKHEKRKALKCRRDSPLAPSRWSTDLLPTSCPSNMRSVAMPCNGAAQRQKSFNSPSFALILSGFPSRVPISRLFLVNGETVGGTTGDMQFYSPLPSRV
jgi:hypothetical protein